MVTKRQAKVLEHVRRVIEEEGIAPTHLELSEVIGTCQFTARRELRKLADLGFVQIWPDKVRRIKILRMPNDEETARCPA